MSVSEAAKVDLDSDADERLVAAWHAHAIHISYLNADDYGGDWKLVPPFAEYARKIEAAIRGRGIERPNGNYLMTDNDRIDWETGEWSPGWYYKKIAARAAIAKANCGKPWVRYVREDLAFEAARTPTREQSEWRDIASAPKDGRNILVIGLPPLWKGYPFVVFWDPQYENGGGWWRHTDPSLDALYSVSDSITNWTDCPTGPGDTPDRIGWFSAQEPEQ